MNDKCIYTCRGIDYDVVNLLLIDTAANPRNQLDLIAHHRLLAGGTPMPLQ